jgi:histidinol-phosphatase
MNDNNLFLKAALEAVEKSRKIILESFNKNITVNIKEDKSPVSEADIKAEEIIKETIKNHFPNHGFLGEESGDEKTNTEYKWIIDPIDGTKGYLRGLPMYSTEIGLMKNNELILGVSDQPKLKNVFWGEKNKGAFKNNERIFVSKTERLEEAYLSFGGLKHFQQFENLYKLSQTVKSCRSYGDSWAYSMLAEGKIDIVIEAKVKIWDISAIKTIVEEAGGKITDIQGNPINTNTTSVIATNGKLHDQVLNYFNE